MILRVAVLCVQLLSICLLCAGSLFCFQLTLKILDFNEQVADALFLTVYSLAQLFVVLLQLEAHVAQFAVLVHALLEQFVLRPLLIVDELVHVRQDLINQLHDLFWERGFSGHYRLLAE